MQLSAQVLGYLRKNACGRNCARSAGEIAAAVGATNRAVRGAVHDLRAAGLPVASSPESTGGFFIPLTVEEAGACSGHLWARVKEIAMVARRFDRAARLLGLKPGGLQQLSLFSDLALPPGVEERKVIAGRWSGNGRITASIMPGPQAVGGGLPESKQLFQ